MKTCNKNLFLLPVLIAGLGLIMSCCAVEAQNNGMQYQIPTAEYNALVDLYNSTGGNAWSDNYGWLDGQAFGWFGVGVSGVQYDNNGNVVVQGNVTQIEFSSNNLNGSIPTSLANLSHLQVLEIVGNHLTGTIPSILSNMTNLTFISLEEDQLSGTIPSSLSNLVNLQTLNLSVNQLSGTIPSSLGNLTNLTSISLEEDQLSGTIPSSLGNLAKLSILVLSDNQLSGGIPDSIGNLTLLGDFDLSDDHLTGNIPPSLGNLVNLNFLDLSYNQLSGTIPAAWGNLPTGDFPPNLYYLNLGNNCLTYEPGSANLLLMQTIAQNPPDFFIYGALSIACANDVTITGQVSCTCDGSPIAGASVLIGAYSTTSDSDGIYSISGIPPGTYSETVSANNYVSITNTVTIPSGSTTITQNLTLSSLGRLDYFGIGVNWQNVQMVGSPPYLFGDLDASNLYSALNANLSSLFNQATSVVVPLNATSTSVSNLNIITTQFNQFTNNVCPNDTIVFYVNTHGGIAPGNITPTGLPTPELALASDYNNNLIFDASYIAGLLNSLPSSTRKIVILDACHSGWIANLLVDFIPNSSALAACSGQSETIAGILYGAETPFYNNGTSVFGDALIVCLNNGVFDLHQIPADINADTFGMYSSVIGSNLSLEDTGSAIFTGLQPQLWEGSGFSGNLTNNVVSILLPPPTMSQLAITNGSFQMTLANMPTNGSVAVELSTDLKSWLQVGFYPAAGTNLTFSFPMTNNSTAFFRTAVVP